MYEGGLVMFNLAMQGLLDIKQCFHWKFINNFFFGENLVKLLILVESASWVGIYGGDFIIFGPKLQDILNFE